MPRLKETEYVKVKHVIIDGISYEYWGNETSLIDIVKNMVKEAEELSMHYKQLADLYRSAKCISLKEEV